MNLPDEWSTGTVSANGIDIQYYRAGSGQPIVLAHGMYDSAARWVPLAKTLTDDYEVIAYDARGHGQSDAPETGYDLDNRVADLLGLLDALDVTDPLLLGHSMGAATVAWAAATHPDLPRGLVLEDPARFHDNPDISMEQAQEITRQKLSEAQSRPVEERIEEHVAEGLDHEQARRLVAAADKASPNIAHIAQEHDPVTEAFDEITSPTLVLRRDRDIPDRVADVRASERLTDGRLVHIPDAGHYIFRDEYDAAYAELQTFLHRL